MNHTETFCKIYNDNVWGGSGGGSAPEVNIEYMKLIENFIRENNIERVIDFGCGDWSFSKHINWGRANYSGIDCVESVVKTNEKLYSAENISFFCSEDTGVLLADLLIVKDVFQHWNNEDVTAFLDASASKFKYILITNTSDQYVDNQDSDAPHERPLNAKFLPLSKYNPNILLETNINEPKQTSLITRA